MKRILLVLVLLFFLATRLYKIGVIPSSVYWDEASIGYNAYAIASDLKDEWGDTLPIHFRAFGEFKLPVYIYSVVPFVKIFGLNAFSVRLPAVFYTLGTLIVVYLLTTRITGKKGLGTFSAFTLSLSPWLFIFSRTGYEVTAGLFFFLLATYIFLIGKKEPFGIVGAIISFILAFYSYNSFRILIPVWLLILLIYKFRKIADIKRSLLAIAVGLAIFLVSLIPVYRLYRYDTGAVRLRTVQVEGPKAFFRNYFSHFGPSFLFFNGDTNPRSQIPGHGELFWIELPLIVLGLITILKSRKFYLFIPLILLLLSPIPAAITRESPHALRSILAAPSYAIISAVGFGFLLGRFKKFSRALTLGLVALYLLSFGFYAKDFFTIYGPNTLSDWQYEYKVLLVEQTSGQVTDQFAQPYIFALFYQKIPPEEFRDTVIYNPVDKWGFSTVASFKDFRFK